MHTATARVVRFCARMAPIGRLFSPSHGMSTSASSRSGHTSEKERGSSTTGTVLRPLWVAAAAAIRRHRAPRAGAGRATARWVSTGTKRAMPSSVPMRMIVSILAPFGTPWTRVTCTAGRAPACVSMTRPSTTRGVTAVNSTR